MAGLLDFPFEGVYADPRSAALTGTAAGLLQAAGPQRFPQSGAQALGQGLLSGFNMWNEAEQARRRSALLNAQTEKLGAETGAINEQLQQSLRLRETLARLAGGGGLSFSPVEAATAAGAAVGDVGPTPGNAERLQAAQQAPEPPPNAMQLLSLGLSEPMVGALMKNWEQRNPKINYQGGIPLHERTGQTVPGAMTVPQKVEGVMGAPTLDAQGRMAMQEVPGSAQLYGQTRDIEQQAANRYISPSDRARIGIESARLGWETGLTPPVMQGLMVPGAVGQPPRMLSYGGAAAPRPSPAVPAAPNPTASPLSPKAAQEGRLAAQRAVDELFAKDAVPFLTGGASDATRQLAQLNDVVKALKAPGANLTGPVIGNMPEQLLKAQNPNAIAMRDRVSEVVQRGLVTILGAQFTEKEGERLIARSYDISLPESENAIRVQRLLTQLTQGLQAKQDAAAYFQRNGTISGWSGKLPSIEDFKVESGPGEAMGGAVTGTIRRNVPAGQRLQLNPDGTYSYRP